MNSSSGQQWRLLLEHQGYVWPADTNSQVSVHNLFQVVILNHLINKINIHLGQVLINTFTLIIRFFLLGGRVYTFQAVQSEANGCR